MRSCTSTVYLNLCARTAVRDGTAHVFAITLWFYYTRTDCILPSSPCLIYYYHGNVILLRQRLMKYNNALSPNSQLFLIITFILAVPHVFLHVTSESTISFVPFASCSSFLAAAPIASLPLACSVTHGHTLSGARRASHASYWWYCIGRLLAISVHTAYCNTIYGMRWYSWAWSMAWPHALLYYNRRIMIHLISVTYLGVRKSSLSYPVISTSQIVIIIY